MDLSIKDHQLKDLCSVNVIIGKNGCGKSTLLRFLDQNKNGLKDQVASIKYLTPERGGQLILDAGIANQIPNVNWLDGTLRRNRAEQFKQISAANFDDLQFNILKKIQDDPVLRASDFSFSDILDQMNILLDNVEIVVTDRRLLFQARVGKVSQTADTLSSGEAELVSLAIEILSFACKVEAKENDNKKHLLLLDEPDVHIHPDLQYKLINFLVKAIKNKPIITIIATHSTAILGALSHEGNGCISFMEKKQKELKFSSIDPTLKDIMPIFGAHPLSNIFNQSPIVLVEGTDEERIWQQAVRSSQGKIKIWPCSTDGIRNMEKYENKANELIGSIYDNAKAYSLRDRDGTDGELQDKEYVIRCRLACYASENLILSNEVLNSLDCSWEILKTKISEWLNCSSNHPQFEKMKEFSDNGFDRKNVDVKDLRNLFMAILGSNKPWEVAVGQEIANLTKESDTEEGSLRAFLSEKLVKNLKLCE